MFSMLRACFILLSIVIVGQLITLLGGAATCFFLFVVGRAEVGACSNFTGQAREMWAEVLAAILALLLASRDPPRE